MGKRMGWETNRKGFGLGISVHYSKSTKFRLLVIGGPWVLSYGRKLMEGKNAE